MNNLYNNYIKNKFAAAILAVVAAAGMIFGVSAVVLAADTDKDFTLDDGSGNSPAFVWQDGDDKKLTVRKQDTGEAEIINDEGSLNLLPSNDLDDYVSLLTAANLPGIFWNGVLAYTNSPAIRINGSGQLEYRDEDELVYTSFDSLAAGGGVGADSLDFVELQDTLDLDAALVLNQTTNTWSQAFTGTVTTGLTYTANSLTAGAGVSVASSATALTGDLGKIEVTGADAGNTGNVLKVGYIGATGTATALNVTNAGTGLTARFNNDGTYADSAAVVIDDDGFVGVGNTAPRGPLDVYRSGSNGNIYLEGADYTYIGDFSNQFSNVYLRVDADNPPTGFIFNNGSVGIGEATPASLLTVGSGDKFQVNTNGNLVKVDNVAYDWPDANGSGVLTNDGIGGLTWSASGGVPADSLDFIEFEDTLDLDAALILNQTANTWSQTFTGAVTTGLMYTANSLTAGAGVSIASSTTALTGDLGKVELSGADAGNTGNVFKVGYTGVTGTATSLNVTNAGTGFTARFNDDGTYTDTTPVVIYDNGNVAIGTSVPGVPHYKLHISENSQNQLMLETTNASAFAVARWKTPSLTYQWALGGATSDMPDKFYVWDDQNNAARILIEPNGNVGVGTSAPQRTLHISNVMRLEPISGSQPAAPALGDIYVDGDTNEICFYNGSAWAGMTGGACD